MKLSTFITFPFVFHCIIHSTYSKAIKAPLDVITLEDLTPEDRRQLEILNHQANRAKRSGGGSGDFFGQIGASIGKAIAKKIGQIAKGSASASARFSGGVVSGFSAGSSGGHEYHHPEPHPDVEHKSFDWWSLKKSILNTLLQAVKAIKGGVIAVKGQLIKGSGHLISAKGRLLSAKGEAISNLGKQIATSAHLVPHPGHSGPSSHGDYGVPPISHYGPPPSSSGSGYGAPSIPSSGYVSPYHSEDHHHHPSAGAHLTHGHLGELEDSIAHGSTAAGLLILKKIPRKRENVALQAEESKTHLEPSESSEYSLANILGKFMSASSSLNPEEPKLFGNKPQTHLEPHESIHVESIRAPDSDYPKPAVEGLVQIPKDAFKAAEEDANEVQPDYSVIESLLKSQSPQSFVSLLKENNPEAYEALKGIQSDEDTSKEQFSSPANSEQISPNFNANVNIATLNMSPSQTPDGNLQSVPSFLPDKLPDGVSVDDLPNIESFGPFPGNLPPEFINQYGSPENKPFLSDRPKRIRPHGFIAKHLPHSVKTKRAPPHLHPGVSLDTSRFPSTKIIRKRQRPGAISNNRHKPSQTFDLVKSVAYELGPNGPVRIQ